MINYNYICKKRGGQNMRAKTCSTASSVMSQVIVEHTFPLHAAISFQDHFIAHGATNNGEEVNLKWAKNSSCWCHLLHWGMCVELVLFNITFITSVYVVVLCVGRERCVLYNQCQKFS